MKLLKNYSILISLLVSFYYNYTTIAFSGKLSSKTFSYKQEYEGKTCPTADHMFTMKVRKKTSCVELCARTTGCTAVTFIQSTFMCTGCKGFYPSNIQLVDQSEALFYIVDCGRPMIFHKYIDLETYVENSKYGAQMTYVCKNPIFYNHTGTITCQSDTKWSSTECEFVDCGTPVAVNNVHFHNFDGYTRYGAEIGFSCTPCTYFSLSSTWNIRCQADGTWTIPDCVYGPDFGRLSNGDVIPAQAVGCNSTLGTTCREHSSVDGPALRYYGWDKNSCYCDLACCGANDCCYDYMC